ncbi:MAG: sensor histidine kinase, partial [Bacteroidota bacterium]
TYIEARDSVNREENQRATFKFEYQQQALQDSLAFVERQAQTELAYERKLAQRNYLLLGGLGLALIGGLGFYLWQQHRLRQKELAHQREMLNSTILTQEKERQRIAKELHDSVGSKLGVMNLFLHQLNRKSPEAQPDVQEMLGVVGETIQTTRRISHDLLPPTLETFGLGTAIQELEDQLGQTRGPQIKVEIKGERPEGIPPLTELNLFRILQELLNNTLKYAQAQHISLRLIQSSDKLILQYRDDGQGFDPQDSENQKGLGTQNIQSRIQMIGGKMDLQTAPGQGVQVQVEVGVS